MRKSLIFSLVVVLCFMGTVTAEWKSLDNSRSASPLQVKILNADSNQIKLEIVVPGYEEKVVEIKGHKYLYVSVPKSLFIRKKGFPLLPVLTRMVKIHDYRHVKLEVVEKDEAEVELKYPIVPSKGHLTRNIDPNTVSCVCGPVYKKDIFFPKKQFVLGKPFRLRKVRGARLSVVPFRPNHVQMKMKVLKRAIVTLTCGEVSNENVVFQSRNVKVPGKAFRSIFNSTFMNYKPVLTRGFPEESENKLVLVYPNTTYQAAVQASKWYKKRSKKYQITEVTLEEIGSTNSAIKDYLQKKYDEIEFTYVILFGDIEDMPTNRGDYERAHSDRVYVRLAGNDYIPDAFISRFSGNVEEVKVQLGKVVAYEEAQGGNWLKSAILIGSLQGSPSDKERCEAIKKDLGKFGYNHFTTAYTNGYDSGKKAEVAKAVNAGVNVICYIGHGSESSWVSTGFSTSDAKNTTNGDKLAVIWSVACVNGAFAKSECFAEGWVRNPNGGAVMMEASSTNEAWVPPCVKQLGTLNAMYKGEAKTAGALEAAGLMAAFDKYGTDKKSEANQLSEQCHIFGDCTMIVRHAKD